MNITMCSSSRRASNERNTYNDSHAINKQQQQ